MLQPLVSALLGAGIACIAVAASAQTANLTDEARRFLVYPPNTILSFSGAGTEVWYLHYTGKQLRKGNDYYNQVIQVTRHQKEEQAVANCESLKTVSIPGKTIRAIPGYPCAFVQEHTHGSGPRATVYRASWYAKGNFTVGLGEGAEPRSMLPASPPVGPLLAALGGPPPLSAAEIAFRNVLFRGLGFAGDTARACLDEVMNEVQSQTDSTMRDQVAQLRAAASAARTVELLSAMPANPEDFDAQWWNALREVAPNFDPSAEERITDEAIRHLPPPLNVLVELTRTAHRGMRAVRSHLTDPKVRGQIYACYRREREGRVISAALGSAQMEQEVSHILADATVCPNGATFKSSYEPELGNRTGEAREAEFRRLIAPLALRFEFIYRVEDARANRETRIGEAWQPVQPLLGRLKQRVNACIVERSR